MYNILHGVNPVSKILLMSLDIKHHELNPEGKWHPGRFRDIHLSSDGSKILLFTRNGGGNRECWDREICDKVKIGEEPCWVFTKDMCPPRMNEILKTHPFYIKDYDDEFDCTYAYFEFKTPGKLDSALDKILKAQGGPPKSLREKFNAAMKEMETMSKEEILNDPRFKPLADIVEKISGAVK